MRWFLVVVFLTINLFGAELAPTATIKANGNVIDIKVADERITVGTDAGTVEVYDLKDNSRIKQIQFEKIEDFMGDTINPKIFSVDYLKSNETYLAVVQKTSGARTLTLIKDGKKEVLIPEKENLFISKAKFVDEEHIMVALLSNEYILFNTKTKTKKYRLHVSYSHFSDFMLNEDKTLLAGGGESGKISIIDVRKGEVVKMLKGANVDNLYKVDFKNGKALGAGQDRRGSVYDVDTGSYQRFDADFLIYAGALSPSASKAAFAFTEDNAIVIFDLKTEERLHTLVGQKSTLNRIVFINEKELISGSDDKFIMRWRLP